MATFLLWLNVDIDTTGLSKWVYMTEKSYLAFCYARGSVAQLTSALAMFSLYLNIDTTGLSK